MDNAVTNIRGYEMVTGGLYITVSKEYIIRIANCHAVGTIYCAVSIENSRKNSCMKNCLWQ